MMGNTVSNMISTAYNVNPRMLTVEQLDYRDDYESGKAPVPHTLGVQANKSLYDVTENPFHRGTIEHVNWIRGWYEVEDEKVSTNPLF